MPEIEKLFKLYLNDQSSPEEVQLLMHYFSLNENEPALKAVIQAELEKPYKVDPKTEEQIKPETDKIFKNIREHIRKKK